MQTVMEKKVLIYKKTEPGNASPHFRKFPDDLPVGRNTGPRMRNSQRPEIKIF